MQACSACTHRECECQGHKQECMIREASSPEVSSSLGTSSSQRASDQQPQMKQCSNAMKKFRSLVASCAIVVSLAAAPLVAAAASAPGPGESIFNLSCAGAHPH
jgi:hypothetical protein